MEVYKWILQIAPVAGIAWGVFVFLLKNIQHRSEGDSMLRVLWQESGRDGGKW